MTHLTFHLTCDTFWKNVRSRTDGRRLGEKPTTIPFPPRTEFRRMPTRAQTVKDDSRRGVILKRDNT